MIYCMADTSQGKFITGFNQMGSKELTFNLFGEICCQINGRAI